MSKTFTPGAHVIITRGQYEEYSAESVAQTAFAGLEVWAVLMRVTLTGKPVAVRTKGMDSTTALQIMRKYR